ncbi:hypothetical protein [Serinibacter salmoneus]|uniref:MinD-like ATPase involved in chromosome partitioning or flagellar assembly n=1 Tax=Serinibacter salmoneus TaxID=556530 RepID=A0A2A9D2S4_9MICO|nr:hypothetical protein [Serinibacter salmoneus]PFG21008.1 hypothetical protein ATL40_2627 [Serinibacter salmoneus]
MRAAGALGTLLRSAGPASGRDLRAWHSGAVAPLAVKRRVGVTALAAGAGCTTVALELATLFATRRAGGARLVLAQGPGTPRSARLETPGLEVVTLAREAWPADTAAWRAAQDRLAPPVDLTITDWGATPANRLRDLADHSHAMCVVTKADRASIQEAFDVATALAVRVRIVLIAVDRAGSAGRATRFVLEALPLPAVLIEHDRVRARGVDRALAAPSLYRAAATVIEALAAPTETTPAAHAVTPAPGTHETTPAAGATETLPTRRRRRARTTGRAGDFQAGDGEPEEGR